MAIWQVTWVAHPEWSGLRLRITAQQREPSPLTATAINDATPPLQVEEPSMEGRVARPTRRVNTKRSRIVLQMQKDVASPAWIVRVSETADRTLGRLDEATISYSGLLYPDRRHPSVVIKAVIGAQTVVRTNYHNRLAH